MNRLTHVRSSGIKQGYWSPDNKEALVQALAAYEETGLEPEEIVRLREERDSAALEADKLGSIREYAREEASQEHMQSLTPEELQRMAEDLFVAQETIRELRLLLAIFMPRKKETES